MKKLIILAIISSVLFSSCITGGFDLFNERRTLYDVSGFVPFSTVAGTDTADVEFGVETGNDIQQYDTDTQYVRFKYYFKVLYYIGSPIIPTVKLNSFSYTDAQGDTIPSILYYYGGPEWELHIIDSLPVIFTEEMLKQQEYGFKIYAECNQSYKSTREIYVNYDIKVCDSSYVKHVKYERKLYLDMRPTIGW